jgi:xylulose-5-phosphate/fructose-6-phosphate phosphoketolase
VNVVDLMTLFPSDVHPHGMTRERFVELFTADRPVVFAFHGYQRAIHEIVHGRPRAARFHVRGFNEQGTTTTPFSMVAMNGMSRYHLAQMAIERTSRLGDRAPVLIDRCRKAIADAEAYAKDHFEDPPHITGWTWGGTDR